MSPISEDTRRCLPLAARPSKIVTRLYNFLYAELGLDFVYQACIRGSLRA